MIHHDINELIKDVTDDFVEGFQEIEKFSLLDMAMLLDWGLPKFVDPQDSRVILLQEKAMFQRKLEKEMECPQ